MPTVYLPLASAEAYGAIGEMMVFQGQTCRAYVIPYDPRTDAQLNVRELFYDVTKMEHFCGAWVRSAWKIIFGSRWYTALYKRVTENGAARYNAAAAVWDGFTTGQKEEWNLAAPFKVTYNAPGEVFYAVMVVMSDWMIELGVPGYEFPGIDADNAAGIGEWAVWTLEDVLTAGSYEESQTQLTYAGSWSLISNASASGGAYRQSAATGTPSVSFYFYGTQFSLVFEKNTGRGSALVKAFGMADQTIIQNDSVQSWQFAWVSVGLSKGLHYVSITRSGTGAINLDALAISSKKIKTPAQTAIADTFVIPSVSLTRTSNQSIPAYSSGGPLYLVEWNAENYDTVGMHDLVVGSGRVVCKVPGYYGVRCFLQFQKTAGAISFRVELRLNGAIVALDEHIEDVLTSAPVYSQVSRFLELSADDYLEVWVRHSGVLVIPITPAASYAPVFEVQMFQRTTLQVGTVNVTEQVGTNNHAELAGLGSDDHPQYLTESEANALYSFVSHLHGSLYAALAHDHAGIYSLLAHVHAMPAVELQTVDIFSCSSPGGASVFVGTIATLPGGAVLTYNITSGNEGALVPTSTAQLGKMRIYNTTRGTNALISNCAVGTNTLTLTANIPAGWVVGDTINIASQTVTGSGFGMVDIVITSGPLNRSALSLVQVIVSATVGDRFTLHPFEAFAASKYKNVFSQAVSVTAESERLVRMNANIFSCCWTGTPTVILVREAGYYP